jgi:hypothetical protein
LRRAVLVSTRFLKGGAKDRAEAGLLAEAAAAGYFADWARPSGDRSAGDG